MIERISKGQWRDYISAEKGERLVNVSLRVQNGDQNERFKFELSDCLRVDQKVILFFPGTKYESKKVLYTDEYKNFADLDMAIFSALSETKGGDLKLVVHYQDVTYRIRDVQHDCNYYLYWFNTLTRYNAEGYVKPMIHNVPVLIEMDGSCNFTNMVCFNPDDICKETQTLAPLYLPACTDSYVPLNRMMFNCENLSRIPASGTPKTLVLVDESTAKMNVRNIISLSEGLFDSDTSIFLEEEHKSKEEEISNP